MSHLLEALWPEASAQDHARELEPVLAGHPRGVLPAVIFAAETDSGELIGFLDVGLRSHADGCDTHHPVGFIEGWFVRDGYREMGVGGRLLAAAEDWARRQGCVEMASDTWLDSDVAQRVHEASGFEVVDRCVHYRKALTAE
jgi:aminoglycoside 6'-N-acetyltransferase I